jgi:Lrp/AsnC family leucine-responsive transcriptional regulator
VPGLSRPNGVHASALLDEVNLRLLEELERAPRITMARLARRVGMSAPAVTERVQRLEEAGVIAAYRTVVEPAALGKPIAAYVRVRPAAGRLPSVREVALDTPAVVECHRVTGDDCFVMKVHVADMEELEAVIDRFLAHGQTNTAIIQTSPIPWRALPLRPADGSRA